MNVVDYGDFRWSMDEFKQDMGKRRMVVVLSIPFDEYERCTGCRVGVYSDDRALERIQSAVASALHVTCDDEMKKLRSQRDHAWMDVKKLEKRVLELGEENTRLRLKKKWFWQR